jgi:hypothetical protein
LTQILPSEHLTSGIVVQSAGIMIFRLEEGIALADNQALIVNLQGYLIPDGS